MQDSPLSFISFLREQYQLDLLIYAFNNPVKTEVEIHDTYLKEPQMVSDFCEKCQTGDARL